MQFEPCLVSFSKFSVFCLVVRVEKNREIDWPESTSGVGCGDGCSLLTEGWVLGESAAFPKRGLCPLHRELF